MTEQSMTLEQANKHLRLFIWAGIAMIALGMFMGVRTVMFLTTAEQTEATVVDVERRTDTTGTGSDRRTSTVYYPTVTFSDTDGNEHTEKSFVGSSGFDFAEGQVIDIYFDPDDPDNFRISSFFAMWGFTIFPIILGLGFLGLTSLAKYVIRHAQAQKQSPQPVDDE